MPGIKGIPDKADYGDITKLRAGELVDWIIQKHLAERAGEHRDIRLGNPQTGLYSWATRKELPLPGKKHLAVRQPLHSYDYGKFEGKIHKGYGKGEVKKEDTGKVLVTKVEPQKIHFTVAHKRYPERFVLFRPDKGIGGKEHNWLLMNITPTKPLGFEKVHYKSVPSEKVEPILKDLKPGSSVQAKIDGALTLQQVLDDKIEVLSHRTSKVHGGPIIHSERVFNKIPDLEIPKKYKGSVLEGELYALDKTDKPLNPQELGGLLNSSLAKAIPEQQSKGINYKNLLFNIRRLGKKDIDFNTPYEDRMQHIKNILSSIKGKDKDLVQNIYHTPEEAKTSEEALKLYKDILESKHKHTEEGIVIHPPTGKPSKSKLFDEHDVYVRKFFPGKGKYTDLGIGGFLYSHDPEGQIVGEVGTGFSDAMRKEMFNDPDAYVGRRARIRTTGKLPSGALFQPSLIALHEG